MSRMTSKLRNKVDVYTKQKVENELGEIEYKYAKLKTIYTQIIPKTSTLKDGQAETEYVESTHKFKVRIKSLPELDNTYRFAYKGQTYEVKYFDPDYRSNEFYDVYTRLVIE
ncbi:phage head closure protein [Anaerosalibacter sp. Marseille-P3206]|uniref:phage head closure protein n=1 Tax=Anaerosalibacter sp. Marseille-P3206 TaxID=1871005 RepID=UPI00098746D8|nr:phage head closure protein [Anaerosalibacter sp. Marseille-P3206]